MDDIRTGRAGDSIVVATIIGYLANAEERIEATITVEYGGVPEGVFVVPVKDD
jgi:hypothetical protein